MVNSSFTQHSDFPVVTLVNLKGAGASFVGCSFTRNRQPYPFTFAGYLIRIDSSGLRLEGTAVSGNLMLAQLIASTGLSSRPLELLRCDFRDNVAQGPVLLTVYGEQSLAMRQCACVWRPIASAVCALWPFLSLVS